MDKNSKNSNFSDFECNFCYKGYFHKICKKKTNISVSIKRNFETPTLTCGNTPFGFLVFFNFFFIFYQQNNNPHIFEEFIQLCANFHKFSMKISGETICQSWLLLALFFNKCIVHCCKTNLHKKYRQSQNFTSHHFFSLLWLFNIIR